MVWGVKVETSLFFQFFPRGPFRMRRTYVRDAPGEKEGYDLLDPPPL